LGFSEPPITSRSKQNEKDPEPLLLTGCEDASVRVWSLDKLPWQKELLKLDVPVNDREKSLQEELATEEQLRECVTTILNIKQ
jgi:hypothetical protein